MRGFDTFYTDLGGVLSLFCASVGVGSLLLVADFAFILSRNDRTADLNFVVTVSLALVEKETESSKLVGASGF